MNNLTKEDLKIFREDLNFDTNDLILFETVLSFGNRILDSEKKFLSLKSEQPKDGKLTLKNNKVVDIFRIGSFNIDSKKSLFSKNKKTGNFEWYSDETKSYMNTVGVKYEDPKYENKYLNLSASIKKLCSNIKIALLERHKNIIPYLCVIFFTNANLYSEIDKSETKYSIVLGALENNDSILDDFKKLYDINFIKITSEELGFYQYDLALFESVLESKKFILEQKDEFLKLKKSFDDTELKNGTFILPGKKDSLNVISIGSFFVKSDGKGVFKWSSNSEAKKVLETIVLKYKKNKERKFLISSIEKLYGREEIMLLERYKDVIPYLCIIMSKNANLYYRPVHQTGTEYFLILNALDNYKPKLIDEFDKSYTKLSSWSANFVFSTR